MGVHDTPLFVMKISEQQFLDHVRQRCEDDFEFFARYMFKCTKGVKYKFSYHLHEITKALVRVWKGETTHLIINMPPRYGKTELVVKMFVSWCYAKNPSCEFIHLSYSDLLAMDNSSAIKNTILSKEFQQLWPIELTKESDGAWKTAHGGVFLARSSGGQVTGYGAGKVDDFSEGHGFGGCFPYWQTVNTDRGLIPIGEICEKGLKVKVESVNVETGAVEFKEIDTYWHNPENDILEVVLDDGSYFHCTPNHEIYTRRGKVRADELLVSDVLVTSSQPLDRIEGASKDFGCLLATKRPVKAFDSSHVANHVKRFKSLDRSPVLIRKICHVDKTYCLEVGGNHNFAVGEGRVLVSNCLLIDDPNKPDDALSDVKRNSVNRRWDETLKSRLNSTRTPVIVIMQRLHEDDFCGMLLRDAEYKFEQLILPAILEEGTDNERALWPEKHSLEQLKAMQAKNSYMFAGQMQQRPTPLGGGIIKSAWFGFYDVLPKIKYRAIFVDTAQKEKESNDYQVASLWGLGEDGNLYLIDMMRDRFQAYELEVRIPAFWNKAKADRTSPLRFMGVEDKASGTQLIQNIRHKIRPAIPLKEIERSRSKLERVMDVQGYIESGYVKLPRNASFLIDFIYECEAFTANDSHPHDDQIDTMCDAITMMLAKKHTLYGDVEW